MDNGVHETAGITVVSVGTNDVVAGLTGVLVGGTVVAGGTVVVDGASVEVVLVPGGVLTFLELPQDGATKTTSATRIAANP